LQASGYDALLDVGLTGGGTAVPFEVELDPHAENISAAMPAPSNSPDRRYLLVIRFPSNTPRRVRNEVVICTLRRFDIAAAHIRPSSGTATARWRRPTVGASRKEMNESVRVEPPWAACRGASVFSPGVRHVGGTAIGPDVGHDYRWVLVAVFQPRAPSDNNVGMTVKITIMFWPPEDPQAFEHHYVETHVPLVQALPGLRAYEYGRALTNFDGSAPDVFWVVSLSFDDVEAMHASFASSAGQLTTADMSNFITGPMKSFVSDVASQR
jgi:uncharacterized protein (TIGR02118 family)